MSVLTLWFSQNNQHPYYGFNRDVVTISMYCSSYRSRSRYIILFKIDIHTEQNSRNRMSCWKIRQWQLLLKGKSWEEFVWGLLVEKIELSIYCYLLCFAEHFSSGLRPASSVVWEKQFATCCHHWHFSWSAPHCSTKGSRRKAVGGRLCHHILRPLSWWESGEAMGGGLESDVETLVWCCLMHLFCCRVWGDHYLSLQT